MQFRGLYLFRESTGAEGLKVHGTDWRLASYATLGEIAAAVPELIGDSGQYDFALPVDWVRDWMHFNPNSGFPRGVWSYKSPSMFGMFVGLDTMLVALGKLILGEDN